MTTTENELREKCENLLWDIALGDEDDSKSVDRLMQLLATEIQAARIDEKYKTHCVTCGLYNLIDRPEDEDICQCE